MRIGILGGSFDPVHLGHVRLAEKMLKSHALARIYFVPVKRSPFKTVPPRASAKDRLAMLNLAIGDNPCFLTSSCELDRPAPSYTIHTIKYFKKRFPGAEIFLLMGIDSLKHLGKWKNSAEIRKLCRIRTCPRIGGISSSKVRARLAKGGSVSRLIPGKVERWIRRKGIYQA